MATFNFEAATVRPADLADWEVIPGVERVVLSIPKQASIDHAMLVDDSKSMRPYWANILADAAQAGHAMAMGDEDGFDLYFGVYNSGQPEDHDSPAGGFLNIADPSHIPAAFALVEAAGLSEKEGIPDRLKEIADKYVSNYKASSDKTKVNPESVLVYTDGDFDLDCFEGSLVQIANDLKDAGAPETQFGVQLYQVGTDEKVKERFEYFDNGLKAAKNLDRDFIDHRMYVPNGETAESLTKVLYGSVVKSLDNA